MAKIKIIVDKQQKRRRTITTTSPDTSVLPVAIIFTLFMFLADIRYFEDDGVILYFDF